jgi:hypothetical protein
MLDSRQKNREREREREKEKANSLLGKPRLDGRITVR